MNANYSTVQTMMDQEHKVRHELEGIKAILMETSKLWERTNETEGRLHDLSSLLNKVSSEQEGLWQTCTELQVNASTAVEKKSEAPDWWGGQFPLMAGQFPMLAGSQNPQLKG